MGGGGTILKQILNAIQKLNIHFVGVGGISMFSLAIYLKSLGHNVSGSDLKEGKTINLLKQNGIVVNLGHNINNVKNANVVIYSFATKQSCEVLFAKNNNIPLFSRAELLGEILNEYKLKICVAGAHGKTTTTALIYSILKTAEQNVDLHLGGHLAKTPHKNLTTNINNKNIIVCEACEYQDAFLSLKPNIAVVTNVANEHLDYFKNYENIKASFNKFSKDANMLICENLQFLQNSNKITFGQNSNFTAKNVKINSKGKYSFNCYKNNQFYLKVQLNLVGEHNIKNALCAIAVSDCLGINKTKIQTALKNFKGVERRYEFLSKTKFIVHDYAHHPDEIRAVINQTKRFFKGKLLVVFQPHTYSRTKMLINEFATCFSCADEVAIYKTYSAREKYNRAGSGQVLAKKVKNNCVYFKNQIKLQQYLNSKISQNYGVLILGAGDIDNIAKKLLKLC